METPVSPLHWKSSWRIIPSRYPVKNVFERIAPPKDLEALRKIERMTSDRRPSAKSNIDSDYVAAAFSYRYPSRFGDGTYGVYYAARTQHTAIQETKYHREKFMRATHEKPMNLGMRVLIADLQSLLHDIRRQRARMPDVYSPTSYRASQVFGAALKAQQSNGIVYESVRDPKGQCAAVFNPAALRHCRQERHLVYGWDGKKIAKVYEMKEYLKLR